MLNAAELNWDYDDGMFSVAGVKAGKLPCGFTVKERIFEKAQAEVILREDFQKEERQWEAVMFGGKTPEPESSALTQSASDLGCAVPVGGAEAAVFFGYNSRTISKVPS